MKQATWGEVADLKYGRALRDYRETSAEVTVFGTNGPIGFTQHALGKGPTVVIGRKGAYRGVHYSAGPFWVIDTAFFLECDSSLVDMRWAYYSLLGSSINSLGSGSAIPSTRHRDFRDLTVLLPDIRTQRSIAEVLGALDDKIAANEKAWRLADDLRRLTFSSGLDDATHVPLSEVARFVNGRPFTKDASGSGRPVIRIAELNSGFGGSTVYNDIEVADDHVARPGDLLFAWSGSLTLRRWYLREGIVNQHIFKVLPAEGWPLWLVASLLERKLDEFKAIAADKATTMGHIQRRHLDDPVPVPTQGWLESNGAKLKSLWDIALAMELESQRLAALRDALLPELMSGRLRVKDVEKTVEEVV